MKNVFRVALAACALAMLSACGSSNLVVTTPISQPIKSQTIALEYNQSTVGVPDEAIVATKNYMEDAFFGGKHPQFRHGNDGITIRYGYIGYKRGSRLGRYFLGFMGNGGANMVLRAEFIDASGNKIGEAQSTGQISSGFLGGSSNSAVKKAVKEIRDYAVAQFR